MDITTDNTNTTTIDIYTDSSWFHGDRVRKNILGYSCVIMDYDGDREYVLSGSIKRQTVREHFGLKCVLNKITIEHGELVAILKSLWQFRKDSYNIRIFSDSLFGLRKIKYLMDNGTLQNNFVSGFLKLVQSIVKVIDKITDNGGSVELFWVKGHAGCVGNTIADKNAKKSYFPKYEIKGLSDKQLKRCKNYSKSRRKDYINHIIDDRVGSYLNSLTDDHFYSKEKNDFPKFKEDLLRKTTIGFESVETKRSNYFGYLNDFIKLVYDNINYNTNNNLGWI